MTSMLTSKSYRMPSIGVQSGGVLSPNIQYVRMSEEWELPSTLWGGTPAMRAARTKYLPQLPAESDAAYEARLNRTFLDPVFKDTIKRLAGQAFLQDVVVKDVPPELEYLEHAFDSEGRSITEVAQELLINQFRFGKAHGIVDYPSMTHVKNYTEAMRENARPYFSPVDPRDLIAWRSERHGGKEVLKQIRILERIVEPVGDFGEQELDQVRVFEPGNVSIWRFAVPGSTSSASEDVTTDMIMQDQKDFTLDEIPLVTAYGEREGFLVGKSPLYDLAWMNLDHWQKVSDQNNIIHVVSVPVFFAKGFEEGELQRAEIGAHKGIVTTSEDAEIGYVEHSGAALDSGFKGIDRLEARMDKTSASVLNTNSVARQTASARQTDRVESMSIMQSMIDSLETMLEHAYEMAGKWIGVDASNVKVSIADEFSLRGDDPNPVDSLTKVVDNKEAMLQELQRRGIVSNDVTADQLKDPEVNTQQQNNSPIVDPKMEQSN